MCREGRVFPWGSHLVLLSGARQDEGLRGGRAGSVGERGLRGAVCRGGEVEEDARAVVRVLVAAEGRPRGGEPGRAVSVGSGRAARAELWGCA